jgi:hypothetical protein
MSHFFNSIAVGKVPGVPEPCLQSFSGELLPQNVATHTLKPLRNGLRDLWSFLHRSIAAAFMDEAGSFVQA